MAAQILILLDFQKDKAYLYIFNWKTIQILI